MQRREPTIPTIEFVQRRDVAAAEAAARNLDGLLVCSRGGGSLDRYANVMYLTNFYTAFPYIPDYPDQWSARAHAFVLLPVSGTPALLVDVPYRPQSDVGRLDVVVAADMIPALVSALRDRGLGGATLGVVGADTLPYSVMQALERELPGVRWIPADDILDALRAVKSPAEIDLLARASEIGSRAIDAMLDAAQPGATHAEVVLAGLQVMVPAGAIMQNAFIDSGTGGAQPTLVNNAFPTYGAREPLAEGQWFHIGLSGVYRGYYFDLARSTPIGSPSGEQIEAFEAAIACVQSGIAAIRPGATANDVAAAGRTRLEGLGFPFGGSFSGMGHGIGLGWDVPWLAAGDPTVLKSGMVLCVERGVRRDGYLGDFEETVVVTESGAELLTTARMRRWS